jgi:tape measure domain-containing protein
MAENVNGGLAFRATLDIDDFNVSAEAMERHIQRVSSTAVQESEAMEQSILNFAQNGAKYIVATLVGGGMTALANSIVQTRGQFQQLEIAFETMLGSGVKANNLMNQLIDTAAKTPFDLMGVSGSAKQLLAYGTAAEKVNGTLVKLGNIASGLSIPLQDMVYLYGTTMVQGRLYAQDVRQFIGRGIPLVRELASMYGKTAEEINAMVSAGKIGFADVEKVINKMTESGGQFYNLMEKQSASLTGMIANLGDAWDMALNQFGKDNQDVFAAGIEGATYLVEHMDDIVNILKAVAIGYGATKAAVVLNTLATKGYTGVALIDNTVRQAKTALLKIEANAAGVTAAQTAKMTAAETANTAALEAKLSAEERANLVQSLRIGTIQGLLTAQQQEYLSNLGLTASAKGYEAAAIEILTVEQREALSKVDLSAKSAIYRTALAQEVAAKTQNQAATLNAMRADVKAAAARVEAAKATAIATRQATEAARYELYWAQQSGKATTIAAAEKKYLGAVENQSIARKAALAAQTDFHTKKQLLETAATRQNTIATVADTTTTETQIVTKSLLSRVTTTLTAKTKALWATMWANPLMTIISVVGLVTAAFTMFGKKEDDATDAMSEFNDTTKKEISDLKTLSDIIRNTADGEKSHKEAVDKVNAICKEYNKTLIEEKINAEDLTTKYNELSEAILASASARLKAKYIEESQQKRDKADEEAFTKFKDAAKTVGKGKSGMGGITEDNATNINNIDDHVFDMIYLDAKELSDKLKGLSVEEYTVKFAKGMDAIYEKVQKTTGAGEAEMVYFQTIFENALKEMVSNANKYVSETSAIIEANDLYNGDAKIEIDTEYAKKSLSELDKLAKDTQTEIDAIKAKTVKVDTDNSLLDELLQKLNLVKITITGKEGDLDTEAGISARIKQLKDERESVKINGKEYKELTKTINRLQAKLPDSSKNAEKNALQKHEQLAKKQLQSELKLEQARIEIMEDGYEKRKASLDLQHKQALISISEEEKELLKAREEAGKKGLSDDEKKIFNERRIAENQSYDNAQNKLLDGEIEYKKSQYELYFRWVENMGQEAADKQFENLLKGGGSYKEYVEKQIHELTQKKAVGSLTEGEGNYLISLNIQYDDINGAKSAMDLFKESVTQSIEQASTLAEKMQAITVAKANLANGKTGLVGADERAEASLFLSQEEEKNNKELQNRVLSDFKTFEEKKKAIQDEYILLRETAIKEGNINALNEINKGEAEALSTLNAQMLMHTDSWKNLFTDLDALTVEQIDKLIDEIQAKMATADLKLNPADMKAVLDKLNEAKQKILDVNPFTALGKAIKAVFGTAEQKSKESSGNIKTDWGNLAKATQGTFDFVNEAIDSCSVLGDIIGDTGKATITMVQGVATAGIAMAAALKTAEKGSVILAAIGVALQAIQLVAYLFNNDNKLEKRVQNIQSNIDALSNSFDRLADATSRTYWEFSDEEREAHQQRVDSINQQIEALERQQVVAKASWNFTEYAALTKQLQDLRSALEKTERSGDMFQLYELQKENLRKTQELIKQQIAAEKDKKKTDKEKITAWEETIKDIDGKIEHLEISILETLAGTDVKSAIDEFADALVDAYVKGEDAAVALGEVTKNVMRNAVVEAIKRQFLAKAINDAVNYLGKAMEDGVLSDKERAAFESMVNAAGEATNAALASVGDWVKDIQETESEATEDPLTGAVRGMSEETGSLVAGKLNAVVINQSDSLSVLRQSLIYHQEIAANTRYNKNLEGILHVLTDMKNSNSLLSQGIS